jgi:hypothetical protein
MSRRRLRYATFRGLEKDRSIGYLLCDALHLLASYLMMNLKKELFIV